MFDGAATVLKPDMSAAEVGCEVGWPGGVSTLAPFRPISNGAFALYWKCADITA